MIHPALIPLFTFYGIFLITCGIISVLFIGSKAKTALLSGGMSGCISLCIAYSLYNGIYAAVFAGLFVCTALFIVFSWRAAKTLFKLFELIPVQDVELKTKGIAFLIISLMAVVSVFVLILQIQYI
ncbi:MAG: hypothetical protein H7259_08035 [Cytophagales bacterium]|nr:hypothetical protein [Cytophaga sp.]